MSASFVSWCVPWLLVVCAAPAPSPGEEGPAPEPELATVVYDLSDLVSGLEDGPVLLDLLPLDLNWRDQGDLGAPEEDDSATSIPELLEALLRDEMAPDEFSREDRSLWTLDGGRLVMTAPPRVHEAFAGLLATLRAATRRKVMLEVDIYRIEQLPDLQEGAPASLDEGVFKLLQRRTEELLLGRTSVRRVERVQPFQRDWEPEIAQKSVASQPEVDTLSLGLTWMLRVEDEPVGGGYRLRWVQRTSELVDWITRSADDHAYVFAEQQAVERSMNGLIEEPRVSVTTVMGSRALQVGEGVDILARMQSLGEDTGLLTRYRLISVDPAPAPVALGAGRELRLLDTSGAYWAATKVPELTPWNLGTGRPGEIGSLAPLAFPSLERGANYAAYETIDELLSEAPGEAFAWAAGSWRLLVGEPAALEAAQTTLGTFAPAAAALTIELAVAHHHQRDGRTELGRLQLPMQSGGTAMALTGICGTQLIGYAVDVAAAAAIADPVVQGFFAGLSLRAEAHQDGSVDLDVLVRRLVDTERVDLGSHLVGSLDRNVFELMRERRRLAADGRLHRWGGLDLDGEGTLEILARVLPR